MPEDLPEILVDPTIRVVNQAIGTSRPMHDPQPLVLKWEKQTVNPEPSFRIAARSRIATTPSLPLVG